MQNKLAQAGKPARRAVIFKSPPKPSVLSSGTRGSDSYAPGACYCDTYWAKIEPEVQCEICGWFGGHDEEQCLGKSYMANHSEHITTVVRKLEKLDQHRVFLEETAFPAIWSAFLQEVSHTPPRSIGEPKKVFFDWYSKEAQEHQRAVADSEQKAKQRRQMDCIERFFKKLPTLLDEFPVAFRNEAKAALTATSADRASAAKDAAVKLATAIARWNPYSVDQTPPDEVMDAKRASFSLVSQVLDHVEVRLNACLPNVVPDQPAVEPQNSKEFVPATQIIKKYCPDGIVLNFKTLPLFIEDNGDIRTRRPLNKKGEPIPNRLIVHLGDWAKYKDQLIEWNKSRCRKKGEMSSDDEVEHDSDSACESDGDPSPTEIQKRKREIRDRNFGK